MRHFKVTETNTVHTNEKFACETRIRTEIKLPFTDNVYRCVMFTGLKIRLEHKDQYIIGILC